MTILCHCEIPTICGPVPVKFFVPNIWDEYDSDAFYSKTLRQIMLAPGSLGSLSMFKFVVRHEIAHFIMHVRCRTSNFPEQDEEILSDLIAHVMDGQHEDLLRTFFFECQLAMIRHILWLGKFDLSSLWVAPCPKGHSIGLLIRRGQGNDSEGEATLHIDTCAEGAVAVVRVRSKGENEIVRIVALQFCTAFLFAHVTPTWCHDDFGSVELSEFLACNLHLGTRLYPQSKADSITRILGV